MQKVRRHFQLKISTAYRVTNSKMFPLTFFTFFKLSFTVLFTIAKFIILSLRGWYPYIPTSFLSSYFFYFYDFIKFTGLTPSLVDNYLKKFLSLTPTLRSPCYTSKEVCLGYQRGSKAFNL